MIEQLPFAPNKDSARSECTQPCSLPWLALVKRTLIIWARSQATKANERSKCTGPVIYQVEMGCVSIICKIFFYEKAIGHCIGWRNSDCSLAQNGWWQGVEKHYPGLDFCRTTTAWTCVSNFYKDVIMMWECPPGSRGRYVRIALPLTNRLGSIG